MPSARPSRFVDTQTLMAEAVRGDFRQEQGPDTRSLPPASLGLRAPADKLDRTDRRDRQEHPAEPGPLTDAARQRVVDLTLRMMDKLTPKQIAIEAGVSTDATVVKTVIKAARKSLAERAEFYVEAHAIATMQAALEGDAKPAQWALEHIAESGDRIIDPPQKEAPQVAPTFNIGFPIGGVPVRPAAQPAIEGEVVKR